MMTEKYELHDKTEQIEKKSMEITDNESYQDDSSIQ
jgi:hypothetical protein